MKIRINRDEFLKNLHTVLAATSKTQIISVLSHVLIEATGTKVTMTANNQALQIKAYFNADVGEDFRITVNAAMLARMFSMFNPGEITLEYMENATGEKSWVTLAQGRSSYKVNALAGTEYQFIEYNKNNLNLEAVMPAAELEQKIREVRHCSNGSGNSSRQHLCSVLLDITEQTARLVATDGHRLALAHTGPLKREAATSVRYLIPIEAVNELMKLLATGGNQLIKIISNEETVIFTGDNYELITNVHNKNEFPLYDGVIPKDNDKVIALPRAELAAALGRVVLIGERAIKVEFEFKNDLLTLRTKNEHNETAEEELALATGGAEVTVTYNSAFILEALAALDCEKIKMSIKDGLTATLIEKVGADDFKFVVMPIRGS